MTKTKLFCLPYAGGSSMVYSKWKKHVHSSIELKPIELAGRGKRYSDAFYSSFSSAVEDICTTVKDELDDTRYALWGHSMGSLLAFELAYKLKSSGYEGPVHIFFSGRYPPHIYKNEERNFHALSDKEFIEEIFRLGGTPSGILESKELQDIFVPILRADYKILHGYRYYPKEKKLDCDISVLNGKQDAEIDPNDISQWKFYTNKECSFYSFDGGHFYINDHDQAVIRVINRTLQDETC